MLLKKYALTFEGAINLNKYLLLVIVGLVLAILVLSVPLALRREAVVLVPPTLEKEAKVSVDKANGEMQSAQALFLVTLMGNVTPNTASFLKQRLSPFLSPKMYSSVNAAIEAQAKQVEDQALSLSFSPNVARYDDNSEKAIVTGEMIVRDIRGNETRELRTYEMGFTTSNYKLLLDHLRVIEGPWSPDSSVAKNP